MRQAALKSKAAHELANVFRILREVSAGGELELVANEEKTPEEELVKIIAFELEVVQEAAKRSRQDLSALIEKEERRNGK